MALVGKNWKGRDESFKDLKAAFDRLYDLLESVYTHLPDLCRCGHHYQDYSKECTGTVTCGERSIKRRVFDALKAP